MKNKDINTTIIQLRRGIKIYKRNASKTDSQYMAMRYLNGATRLERELNALLKNEN